MSEKRRTFTREFKIEAVRMLNEDGMSLAEVARALDIHQNSLRSWKLALDQEAATAKPAFPGNGNLSAHDDEIRRLKDLVRRLTIERDLLKKATALFAQDSL